MCSNTRLSVGTSKIEYSLFASVPRDDKKNENMGYGVKHI